MKKHGIKLGLGAVGLFGIPLTAWSLWHNNKNDKQDDNGDNGDNGDQGDNGGHDDNGDNGGHSDNGGVPSSDEIIEIPSKIYNINKKYIPNNSGLSNYNGDQFSYEGHLQWSQNNCWVLSNLYLLFRPELESTYQEYASKPIKDIIYDLDNLPGNESCTIFNSYAFCKDMSNILNKLKNFIQNKNIQEAYELLGKEKYISQDQWKTFSENKKLNLLAYFYNYHTIFRFEYAVSLKNRCRIYIKMIKNPTKMVNVYKMDDFCEEGDFIPKNWLLSTQDYYIKAQKILGRNFSFNRKKPMSNFNTCIEGTGRGDACICVLFSFFEETPSFTNSDGFNWKPGIHSIRILSPGYLDSNSIEISLKKAALTDEQINDIIKYGKKTVNNEVYRLIAIRVATEEYGEHARVIRLKYDNDLKCSQVVDKDCYHADDNIVNVADKENLFKFIFDHMKKWKRAGSKVEPAIETFYFITEDELRNNLKYYEYHKL